MTNIQIGTILIAKEDIKMKDGSGVAIIKGNEYKIKDLILDVFIVKSELFDNHEFDIEDLDKYFTIKRYTLTDLQTRTDIMVRIENEEEAKKLGNKWYNTHYFSDELLYGHIKGVKEIIYLEADELEGRTLVPSIDLIDLEVKEELTTPVKVRTVEFLENLVRDYESEIARLKGDNEMLKSDLGIMVSQFEILQLRESPQISQNLEKRERMAWELMLRSVQVENSKHYSLSAEYCLNEVDTFLAKSKEVGNGK